MEKGACGSHRGQASAPGSVPVARNQEKMGLSSSSAHDEGSLLSYFLTQPPRPATLGTCSSFQSLSCLPNLMVTETQSWHPSISRPPKGGIISAREKDKTERCPHHSSLSFRIKEEEQCHQESWAGSEKLCLQDKLKPIVKILYIFKRNSFMENKKVLNDSWINR